MTMIMTPTFHIGYQKTATTFLQEKVFSNRDIFYLPWGNQPPEAIEEFVLVHPKRYSPEKIHAALSEKIEEHEGKVPIISHEDLSGYPIYGRYYADQVSKRIHSAFPNAKIIIGIREQYSMLASQYFQYVRQGGTRKFNEMVYVDVGRIGFRPTIRFDHFEYDLMFEIYTKLFGGKNVLILPIELLRIDPDKYFLMLDEFLGVSDKYERPVDVVLPRRSVLAMRIERLANNIVRPPIELPEKYAYYPMTYRAKNRILRVIDDVIAKSGVLSSKGGALEGDIRKYIPGYYNKSNSNLSKMINMDLVQLGYE
jgi:hypothetical protein